MITYTVTDESDASSQKGTVPIDEWVWTSETADLAGLGLIKQVRFDISNRADFGIDSMKFELSGTGGNVPEPASLALVGLALAGVAASRRRAKA